MQKKLTITIDEEVYEGLRMTIGPAIAGGLQGIQRHISPCLFAVNVLEAAA